jgi:putative endonuclease
VSRYFRIAVFHIFHLVFLGSLAGNSVMIVRESLKTSHPVSAMRPYPFSEEPEIMPTPSVSNHSQQLGQAGEDAALAYLLQQGLTLVTRNFRCRAGEIDLVMKEGNTLIFVEVRKRANSRFGDAASSITRQKQQRLIKTARFFLQKLGTMPPSRFDAIALDGDRLTWLKNIIEET